MKSKISQLELPPIGRISLGSQVFDLGKIRLEELISTNRTYLGWTPITLGLSGFVELANRVTEGVGTIAKDGRRGSRGGRHGKKELTVLSVGVLRPMTNPRTEAGSYIQGWESFM